MLDRDCLAPAKILNKIANICLVYRELKVCKGT
nr:MAG TPA: hypothetical protein [Bacteriophage sp.]